LFQSANLLFGQVDSGVKKEEAGGLAAGRETGEAGHQAEHTGGMQNIYHTWWSGIEEGKVALETEAKSDM
jgi:hypothetical protein